MLVAPVRARKLGWLLTLGHLTTTSKDAIGMLFSGVGIYMSLLLATRFPNAAGINQFFNAVTAAAIGVGSVAAAVTIAWQKVLTTSRGIRADLIDTRKEVSINKDVADANAARIAALEKEAVALREKANSAENKVHIAHKLARQAINQATAEVSQIKTESAAEIAALKNDLRQFHERYHDTVKVVNKLNLESEVREREAAKSNDPDKEPSAPEPTHIIIDNIEKLAALDALDSSDGIPVVVVDKPRIEPKAEPDP